jgi:hypothetical protein
VIVDLSNLNLAIFSSSSLLTIDSATSAASAPTPVSLVTPGTRIQVTLPGYGVAWLQLTPVAP